MSMPEDEPIIVRPTQPIIVKPVEILIAGPPIWLRQEIGQRGKNTCYPTSVINASIAVGAIEPKEAEVAYESVMQDLLQLPHLWNGANLNIGNENLHLMDLFEYHLPIRLGYQQGGVRFLTIPHSFDQILRELENPIRHVIVNGDAKHAYATVNKTERTIVYINATEPKKYLQVNRDHFGNLFGMDDNGWVNTTLVQPR